VARSRLWLLSDDGRGARVYFEVDNLEAAFDAISENGGSIERRHTALGGADHCFGIYRDPTRTSFGLWTATPREPMRLVPLRQRGSAREPVEELVQVYAQERPGVPVTVHESRHTWQELEDAQAALLSLPDHQKTSFGMGLNEERSDVRLVVDLLYPTAEVLARLEDLPDGIVQVNYLVRPLREVPGSA
jgi:hypothetical protein